MAYQIILKQRFINKFKKTLWYIEEKWGKQLANQLITQLDERLDTLANQPLIGISSEKIEGAKSFLLTKHNRVYYRIKGKQIEIVNLYNTRINTIKNIYK
ncbi:MAG: type II toxin-antitoxin system RelE/ParE family toxin [Flavobacterium sp.]|nr:type II toxin-antitoxin system RelE/ParE family toxin [Flavobacterium sp.]